MFIRIIKTIYSLIRIIQITYLYFLTLCFLWHCRNHSLWLATILRELIRVSPLQTFYGNGDCVRIYKLWYQTLCYCMLTHIIDWFSCTMLLCSVFLFVFITAKESAFSCSLNWANGITHYVSNERINKT